MSLILGKIVRPNYPLFYLHTSFEYFAFNQYTVQQPGDQNREMNVSKCKKTQMKAVIALRMLLLR